MTDISVLPVIVKEKKRIISNQTKRRTVAANPEALDALVRELSSAAAPTATAAAATTAASKATATPSAKSASLFPSGLR
uniref:Uncharacterized protein n=1 Tax=Oryza punctata TaxID=4537 RepID=A0A0E0KFE6_ORYPU